MIVEMQNGLSLAIKGKILGMKNNIRQIKRYIYL